MHNFIHSFHHSTIFCAFIFFLFSSFLSLCQFFLFLYFRSFSDFHILSSFSFLISMNNSLFSPLLLSNSKRRFKFFFCAFSHLPFATKNRNVSDNIENIASNAWKSSLKSEWNRLSIGSAENIKEYLNTKACLQWLLVFSVYYVLSLRILRFSGLYWVLIYIFAWTLNIVFMHWCWWFVCVSERQHAIDY